MVAEQTGAVGGMREAAARIDAPGFGDFARSTAAQDRLHESGTGGAQTYARGSDQYPEGMAPVLTRGQGARVWDLDGREYVEYGIGLRSVTLGHGHPPVTDAVARAIADGVSFCDPRRVSSTPPRPSSTTWPARRWSSSPRTARTSPPPR